MHEAIARHGSAVERRHGRHPIRLRSAAAALLAGTALAVAVGAANAAPTRRAAANGLIVFQAHAGQFNQLFTIKPDGSGLTQVTKIPFTGDTEGAEQAGWSPDGKAIAFDAPSLGAAGIVIDVFTVHPDGSGITELPLGVQAFNGAPSYSPDGTKIAFDQDAGDAKPKVHGIYVTNADWSPDGTRIAFTRVRDGMTAAIFVVRADGRGLKRLTPWSLDASGPAWSPDGSKLLFQSYYDEHAGQSSNLFTITPSGGKMTPLTHFKGGIVQALGPAWSPDGKRIVWHKVDPKVNQLFTMDAHGGHVRKLTSMPGDASPSHADWGTAPA
jgi:Tol biopolymer transport system component